MTKTKTIDWKPFSDKHKQYMRSALNNRMCVAEGAIRSGKTIDHCIIARRYLEYCKDKIHLATGSTLGNAKLNIGDCNGFGLEHQFRGRCQWGKYKGNECLKIKTKTGEKIVIFAGGKNADSYKKILGNSYGLWIATEINEHYDDEDSQKSFIKVAFGRQAAAQQPLVLWDLNPCAPAHKIYEDYIDKYKENFVGGYQYEHFLLDDNLSISEQRKAEIKSQYDEGSIWYKRDILGQRCVAEGRIYTSFDRNKNVIDIEDWNARTNSGFVNFLRNKIIAVTAGVDFGGNKSATTFTLSGFTKGFQETIVLKERYIAEEITPAQLESQFMNWISECLIEYPILREVYCDSAEQVLIRGLKAAAIKARLPVVIRNAQKGEIKDRIRFGVSMFAQQRFYILSSCKETIEAYDTALWDRNYNDDVRLDDGTTNIDSLDATEYSQEPYIRAMIDMTITR